MALPTSRNTTYAAAAQVKSVDLNAMQDCIVESKHPTRRYWFSPIVQDVDGAAPNLSNNEVTATGLVGFNHPVQGFFVGQRITGFGARVEGINTAASDIHIDLFVTKGDGSADAVGPQINWVDVGGFATLTSAAAPALELAELYTLYFRAQLDVSGQKILSLFIDVDNL